MKTIPTLSLALILLAACTSAEEKEQRALMEEFTEVGHKIAKVSFASLSGNLKAAMTAGGPENAIKFCNINAQPLTDSLSKAFKARIKRTSLKLRNPLNRPDSLEIYILDLYAQIEKMQKPMVGKTLLSKENEVRYFAPIVLKAQCLLCHGTVGREVKEETYALIKKYYPDDQATGYREGQLRGIWSINFGPINQLEKAGTGTD